ncbi:protein trichome birefringence-like 19 [Punica granatum]|uniref:Protein trichome birefringence-like 19 n=1 Tax=Punica granatum TaxID=22663 RepID=A0A218VVF5_PUNGR|nr:protein trichome birefringence-like 19 [Punica granatum]OWM64455.1 hypothetical protein CDL15_Pgr020422 [Punica granatum]
MKIHISNIELPRGKLAPQKRAIMLAPTLVVLVLIPLYLFIDSSIPLQPPSKVGLYKGLWSNFRLEKPCDVFRGEWVLYPNATYYTNETCPLIIDQQNCLKFGRPDTEYLKWKWKPEGCELPRFDAVEFLEIAKGKSVAFVGDSVGRNQMQSLLCLLASVSHPEDITSRYTSDTINFRRWFFPEFNFTLASFWAPFLVKAVDSDSNGHTYTSIMSLHLDEPEEAWAREVENFDYVIISAGQWFYRPMIFYEKGQLVGCSSCGLKNVTEIPRFYGYGMAFRTSFRILLDLKGYKGVTFLRTFSPGHFENGPWNDGGNCIRTRPFGKEEVRLMGYDLEFYKTQVEEYRAAERESRSKRRLKFKLLDTTEASLMRPDGHPNTYGHSPHKNSTFNDCVHWCVPGPIDTWNEFLIHLMKPEIPRFSFWKLRRGA